MLCREYDMMGFPMTLNSVPFEKVQKRLDKEFYKWTWHVDQKRNKPYAKIYDEHGFVKYVVLEV